MRVSRRTRSASRPAIRTTRDWFSLSRLPIAADSLDFSFQSKAQQTVNPAAIAHGNQPKENGDRGTALIERGSAAGGRPLIWSKTVWRNDQEPGVAERTWRGSWRPSPIPRLALPARGERPVRAQTWQLASLKNTEDVKRGQFLSFLRAHAYCFKDCRSCIMARRMRLLTVVRGTESLSAI